MHYEKQPHRYAYSWTVACNLPPDHGGHFYNGSYRVRIQGAPDTVVVWKVRDWHGTSLQDIDTSTTTMPAVYQSGLAIVTPVRFLSLMWKMEGLENISPEDAEECLVDNISEEEVGDESDTEVEDGSDDEAMD